MSAANTQEMEFSFRQQHAHTDIHNCIFAIHEV